MKKLTEGFGLGLNNKFINPFTGFVKSYQLITCQYLVCPFKEPESSKSGYNEFEFHHEKLAMEARTKLVNFNKAFIEHDLEFGEIEWAQCLEYMAE